MENTMEEYFQGEKKGGLILMIWAASGLVAGGVLHFQFGGLLQRGMAVPVVIIAILHLVVGAAVFLRTESKKARLVTQLKTAPGQFLEEESVRMQRVMSNFEKYKLAEQILFFLGCAFTAGGVFFGGGEYMLGSGIGICIQSAFTLVFDLFASFRGGLYLHELNVFRRDG